MLATLLFGASGSFAELRRALNRIWGVELVASGFLQAIRVRLLSFGMVVMVGFLLLVSLIFAACIAALNSVFTGSPSWLQLMLAVIQLASSLVVESLLFAAIFKMLPETHLRWADVILGGFITAMLFELGKSVIGLYLGNAGIGSMYGAAGSLVVLLVWVYYSSQIVFVGAELTRAWTLAREGGATERRRRSEVLAGLPASNGMAFIVVQHLDPDHASRCPSSSRNGRAWRSRWRTMACPSSPTTST